MIIQGNINLHCSIMGLNNGSSMVDSQGQTIITSQVSKEKTLITEIIVVGLEIQS